jgi:hypothetical protein
VAFKKMAFLCEFLNKGSSKTQKLFEEEKRFTKKVEEEKLPFPPFDFFNRVFGRFSA